MFCLPAGLAVGTVIDDRWQIVQSYGNGEYRLEDYEMNGTDNPHYTPGKIKRNWPWIFAWLVPWIVLLLLGWMLRSPLMTLITGGTSSGTGHTSTSAPFEFEEVDPVAIQQVGDLSETMKGLEGRINDLSLSANTYEGYDDSLIKARIDKLQKLVNGLYDVAHHPAPGAQLYTPGEKTE